MTRSDYTSNVRLVTCFEITGSQTQPHEPYETDTLDRETYNVEAT
jgi:hypothetical protein